ncbi:hypothetical protein L484_012803 [Morus notabilis]|uniref:Uncharacterized protein n=1 Tax=Morus notabilis TaxID=981085 RepID=W9SZ61_9ROSA|nr:hypothetical protein L484_012803 [Morus notabilis]
MGVEIDGCGIFKSFSFSPAYLHLSGRPLLSLYAILFSPSRCSLLFRSRWASSWNRTSRNLNDSLLLRFLLRSPTLLRLYSSKSTKVTVAIPEVSHLGWGHWYTLRELEALTGSFSPLNVVRGH